MKQELIPPSPPVELEKPLVQSGHTNSSVTAKISGIVLRKKMPRHFYVGLAMSCLLLLVLLEAVSYLLAAGVGIWGINIPVAWGFAIINFVWWIGIGHAGTLISAILLLLRQDFRTSINRFAEAMTLFAVACAGLFPLLHLGRPWFFYWMLPYHDTMRLWPQFRSPLVWDIFAVLTYFSVSLMFWYLGLIPDLATMRDRAQNSWARKTYGILALGWRGSARHWSRYERVYLLLAGLATPLVVSVHSIVSLDFAAAQVPGWHNTLFPPYFVAGAIFSGLAMVLTLVIPVRAFFRMQDFITARHLDILAKLLLATGLIVFYSYLLEHFTAWYSGDIYEEYVATNRMFGPYAKAFWTLVACNVIVPQALWFRRVRSCVPALFVISLLVNLGMWIERYVIIVTSLHRDFLPSSWGMYAGTVWDYATLLGSFGLFFTLLFLFMRSLPMISMAEMRKLVSETKPRPHESEEPGT